MTKLFVITMTLLFGCSKAAPKPAPLDPSQDVIDAYVAAEDRLVSLSDNGWVVSKDGDNISSQGDSLLFSWMAVGATDCDHRGSIESALSNAIQTSNGALYRHPSLPDSVSLDGAIGLYYGLATAKDCGTDLKGVLALHRDFVKSHGMRLNASSDTKLVPEFDYVLDLLSFRFGIASEPDASKARAVESEVSAWAFAVMASKSACYRIHLGYLTMRSLEALGAMSEQGRSDFCSAAEGADIPIVDHWCGRGDLEGWLTNFKENEWEYRHQRCGGRETPDGNGRETPGLDLIVAMKDLYEF